MNAHSNVQTSTDSSRNTIAGVAPISSTHSHRCDHGGRSAKIMLNGRKLVADTFCDVYNLLEPWIDDHFWDFESFDPEPGSICLVGRKQAVENTAKLRDLCTRDCTMVFANLGWKCYGVFIVY
jgi:hypothetical protein